MSNENNTASADELAESLEDASLPTESPESDEYSSNEDVVTAGEKNTGDEQVDDSDINSLVDEVSQEQRDKDREAVREAHFQKAYDECSAQDLTNDELEEKLESMPSWIAKVVKKRLETEAEKAINKLNQSKQDVIRQEFRELSSDVPKSRFNEFAEKVKEIKREEPNISIKRLVQSAKLELGIIGTNDKRAGVTMPKKSSSPTQNSGKTRYTLNEVENMPQGEYNRVMNLHEKGKVTITES
jgi:hypothetical protein